jgi:hypothetical protein
MQPGTTYTLFKSRLNKSYTLDIESLDLEYFNRTPSQDCADYALISYQLFNSIVIKTMTRKNSTRKVKSVSEKVSRDRVSIP